MIIWQDNIPPGHHVQSFINSIHLHCSCELRHIKPKLPAWLDITTVQ